MTFSSDGFFSTREIRAAAAGAHPIPRNENARLTEKSVRRKRNLQAIAACAYVALRHDRSKRFARGERNGFRSNHRQKSSRTQQRSAGQAVFRLACRHSVRNRLLGGMDRDQRRQWPEDFNARLNPERAANPALFEGLDVETPKVLDVGAGPMSI